MQAVAQLLRARRIYGSADDDLMQFVAAASGGASDLQGHIRQAIWSRVYTMV